MTRYLAKAELIIDADDWETEQIELDITELELGVFELDKAKVQNIRKKSDLVRYLLDKNSDVYYNYPPRERHEVYGGYKKAVKKNARLFECQVYNLYFRFRSWLKGDGIALMCRPPMKKEEWIILLPDDTIRRIKKEKKEYLQDARNLTLIEQTMDPDNQNILVENLNLLDLHERCAQSLIHEYGHVLHYRMFDLLNITSLTDQYLWFTKTGYLDIVDQRYPSFANLSPSDKLTELKEALVEDYRISLNLKADNGMFILPNKVCYLGDFQLPYLMYKGVDIMKEMLSPTFVANKRAGGQSSPDVDSLVYIQKLRDRKSSTNWRAGTPSMTKEVRSRDLALLQMMEAKQQHAVAIKA